MMTPDTLATLDAGFCSCQSNPCDTSNSNFKEIRGLQSLYVPQPDLTHRGILVRRSASI